MIQHVFRPSRRRDGKRVSSRIWWGQYRLDGDSMITRVSLKTSDKRVAEKRLAQNIRELELEREGIRAPMSIRQAANSTVQEHLEEYEKDLKSRGRTQEYIRHVRSRVLLLANECGWIQLSEVTAESFIAWRSSQDKSAKTLNDYLDAVRAWWNG